MYALFGCCSLEPCARSQLRALLSSLQIKTLPALAARLAGTGQCNSDCDHLKMLKETLQEMLSKISFLSTQSDIHRTVQKYIIDNIKADSSSIADACKSALLKEIRAHVQVIKPRWFDAPSTVSRTLIPNYIDNVSGLLWLVNMIPQYDEELFETVLKMFCEDADFPNAVITNLRSREAMIDILEILINRFLKALSTGEVIIPASIRVSYLTNWIATMLALTLKIKSDPKHLTEGDNFQEALERGIVGVADTLPLTEQKGIYNIWKNVCRSNLMDTSSAFNWWTKRLQDAHHEP